MCIHHYMSHEKWHMFQVSFQMYLISISFFLLPFLWFFNYLVFLETSLLQGGPALYCRADLHCTALKGDMWHPYPLSNIKVSPPKKIKLLFSDPILAPLPNFFWHPPKGFLLVSVLLFASVKRVSVSRMLEYFWQSVVAISCMPIMEL